MLTTTILDQLRLAQNMKGNLLEYQLKTDLQFYQLDTQQMQHIGLKEVMKGNLFPAHFI